MDSQIHIWVEEGKPLTQSQWESAGFQSLKAYVETLQKESQLGYKRNGKRKEAGDHMPLLQVGFINLSSGEKFAVASYPTYDDLPEQDLSYNGKKLIHFDKCQNK